MQNKFMERKCKTVMYECLVCGVSYVGYLECPICVSNVNREIKISKESEKIRSKK